MKHLLHPNANSQPSTIPQPQSHTQPHPHTTYVSWRSLAPIFADLVISPWNLLIGGLLIQHLPTWKALLSIIIGYTILAVIFILYGGLGYQKRLETSAILHQVFGNHFSRYVIPIMLALGQIGWAAIYITLGGSSLAALTHIAIPLGMVIYAPILGIMASLDFYRLAIAKIIIIASSILLTLYLAIAKLLHTAPLDFITYHPDTSQTLLWGISVVVASLISFASVTPDFFRNARHQTDVTRSTLIGFVGPGIIMASLGCLLFFDQSNYNLTNLIATLALPIMPSILNVVTNTDGSLALYTPALKLIALRSMRLAPAVAIITILSLALALLNLANQLNLWLSILSVMTPVFIGVASAAILFDQTSTQPFRLQARSITFAVYILTLAACLIAAFINPSVLLALAMPLFLYSAYFQYRLIHQK